MNAIVFGERGGRGQKVVAYSDVIFTMLNLFSSFTDDKMILQAIAVHDVLLLCCRNILFFLTYVMCYMMHIS